MLKIEGMSDKQRVYWAYECFYADLDVLHRKLGIVLKEIDGTKIKNLSDSDIMKKVDFVSRSMEDLQRGISKMREME